MFKNYFKIAWRSVSRYKSYSIINILGLALGIASCLMIFLVVRNELSYDNFHKKADHTYRVTMNALDFNPSVSMAIVPALQSDFPQLENVSQFWFQQEGLVNVNVEGNTVQVPIGVAAQVCPGVAANVLAEAVNTQTPVCDITQDVAAQHNIRGQQGGGQAQGQAQGQSQEQGLGAQDQGQGQGQGQTQQ